MPKFTAVIDTSKIPIKGLVAESSGTAPANSVPGQYWFDTTSGKNKFTNDGTNYLDPLSRANHTGTQLANTISDFAAAVQAIRLDQLTAPTAPVSMGNQRITNVSDQTGATDAANKQYVDNARAGLAVKDPVRVVATTNINLASLPANIDGVAMAAGQSFLAVAQTTGTQNGLYTYPGSGQAATRRTDADATGEVVDGTMVAVAEGTDAGAQYIQTATPAGAPGAWTQTWVKYSTGGQTYTAGNGLSLNTNTFAVVAGDGTIVVDGTGVKVGLNTVAKGGTGATTAAGARTNLGAVGKYAADLGTVTAGNPVTVNHGLNTTDVTVTVRETSGGAVVIPDVVVVDANNVTVTSGVAYASGALRVVVMG
ncbi:hypothetical protein GCM10010423_65200 [Streptomyces levis]|uniref:Tail fiber protein n=1 Tax=Streptomyces levis TaxID=285566 RepID=A0ABN3P1B7_9ACTN